MTLGFDDLRHFAAAQGWLGLGDGGRKIREDKQPNFQPHLVLILPGVCGKLPRTGRPHLPGSGNFP